MKKRVCLFLAGILLSYFAWAGGGQARPADGEWVPSRNIDWVVTSSAGGGSDIFTRFIADILVREGLVDRSILVTNNSTGMGEVGRAQVAGLRGAAADHTLMTFNSGDLMTMVQNTSRRVNAFQPIAIMAIDKQLLYVSRASRFQSFQEVMDAVRAGQRIVAGGSRGDDQMTFEMLLDEMGWTEEQVPYIVHHSSNDAIVAALGGHIDIVVSKPAAASAFVEAGELIPILALANERLGGDLASAPTVSEMGAFNNVEFPVWRGIAASPQMSPEAQAFWASVLQKVAETNAWKYDYLDRFLLIPVFMDHQQSTVHMSDFEREFLSMEGVRW